MAARIRRYADADDRPEERGAAPAAFGGGARAVPEPVATYPAPRASSPAPTPRRRGSGSSAEQFGQAVVATALYGGWGVLLITALSRAFQRGELLMPRWAILTLSWLLLPAGLGGGFYLFEAQHNDAGAVVGGIAGAGGLVLGVLARHVCVRCSRWMSIDSRTISAATYSRSGKGETTYHCSRCGYHDVQIYTIARLERTRTRSSSWSSSGSSSWSSSSSSSSRSSSFGGGYSSGGGGGASW